MLNVLKTEFKRVFSPPPPPLQRSLPNTKSHVRGFTVNVRRKDGCVLRHRPENSPKDTLYTDAGVDEHFEVSVDYDGSNPLYPDVKQGTRKVALLTNSLRDKGHGMIGSVFYYPKGIKFTRVEIEENYENWKHADIIGRGMPKPEHVVWLAIYAKHDGDEFPYKVGVASRPV